MKIVWISDEDSLDLSEEDGTVVRLSDEDDADHVAFISVVQEFLAQLGDSRGDGACKHREL